MNLRAQASDWESGALGVRVGTLDAGDILLPDAVVRAVNRDLFDVVFVRYDCWINPAGPAIALDHLYDMEASVSAEKPGVSDVSMMCYPSAKHVTIAMEAFSGSRFLKDPRLSAKSSDRYVRWLSEHQAYVATEAPDDAFLVLQDDADGARRISLIAVASDLRGSGLGTRLVTGVFSIEPNKKIWRVRVSSNNNKAIRFYRRLGFLVKNTSTTYHVWMRSE